VIDQVLHRPHREMTRGADFHADVDDLRDASVNEKPSLLRTVMGHSFSSYL